MKNQSIQILVIVFIVTVFFSCNQKVKVGTKTQTEIEFVDVDLSKTKAKFPLIAKVPKKHIIIDSETHVNFKSDEFEYSIEKLAYSELFNDVTSSWNNKVIIKTPNSFLAKTNTGAYYAERIVTLNYVEYSCSKNNIKTEKEGTELLKIMGMLKLK